MGNEQMEHLIDLPAEETATKPAPPAMDFDLENYKLTQDYASLVDVKKIITTVPVKKPEKLWFIRVHPTWQFETALLEDSEDRSSYLVQPSLWPDLGPELSRKVLFAAINTQGVFFRGQFGFLAKMGGPTTGAKAR